MRGITVVLQDGLVDAGALGDGKEAGGEEAKGNSGGSGDGPTDALVFGRDEEAGAEKEKWDAPIGSTPDEERSDAGGQEERAGWAPGEVAEARDGEHDEHHAQDAGKDGAWAEELEVTDEGSAEEHAKGDFRGQKNSQSMRS